MTKNKIPLNAEFFCITAIFGSLYGMFFGLCIMLLLSRESDILKFACLIAMIVIGFYLAGRNLLVQIILERIARNV
jgi:hypothetical protein